MTPAGEMYGAKGYVENERQSKEPGQAQNEGKGQDNYEEQGKRPENPTQRPGQAPLNGAQEEVTWIKNHGRRS
jgi:hypothetical protein